jgi:hypothetical protein
MAKDRSGAEIDMSTNEFAQRTMGGLPPPPPRPAPKPVDDPPPAAAQAAGEGAAQGTLPLDEASDDTESHEGEIVDDVPGRDDGGEFEEPSDNDPADDMDELFSTMIIPSNRTGTLKGGGYTHVRNPKKRTVKLSFSVQWETMELLRRAQFYMPPHISRNLIVDKVLAEGLGELVERARRRRQFGAQIQTPPPRKNSGKR